MTNTLPDVNFVDSAPRRGTSASTASPITPMSGFAGAPRGMPISITSTSPACALPGRIHSPGLARWNVAVATARTAAPATSPVDASTPDGMSAATTGALAAFSASIAPAAGSRGAPEEPVPSSASTSACAPSSRSGANGAGGSPGSRFSCSAASPCRNSGDHTVSTSTSRPAPRRSRAATSPSPPLLPLPQTMAMRPAGARWAITRASPSPARSIRSSDGTRLVLIAHSSVARICAASSSGSIQRGRLTR
jgi:hypothetical protein